MLNLLLLITIFSSTTIRELGTSGIEITFSTEKATREEFSFPEAAWLNDVGEPDVPSLSYKIGIPQDGNVEVSVIGHDESVFKDAVVEPVTR